LSREPSRAGSASDTAEPAAGKFAAFAAAACEHALGLARQSKARLGVGDG